MSLLMNFKDFIKELSPYKPGEIVFVGLGNELCGDDAAGLLFLDKLKDSTHFIGSDFIKAYTNPENYLHKVIDSKARVVVIIDAARCGGRAGEISWIDPHDIKYTSISTHAFSIKLLEKYLLNHRMFEFKYLGIEPLSTNHGDFLSSQVLTQMAVFFARV